MTNATEKIIIYPFYEDSDFPTKEYKHLCGICLEGGIKEIVGNNFVFIKRKDCHAFTKTPKRKDTKKEFEVAVKLKDGTEVPCICNLKIEITDDPNYSLPVKSYRGQIKMLEGLI